MLFITVANTAVLTSSLYLTALISQHHQIFVTCYHGVKLIPKMHYHIFRSKFAGIYVFKLSAY